MLLQTYVILITLWENINKIVGFVHFGIYILISHGEPLQILDVRPNTYFGVSFFFRSFWRKKRKHKIKKKSTSHDGMSQSSDFCPEYLLPYF